MKTDNLTYLELQQASNAARTLSETIEKDMWEFNGALLVPDLKPEQPVRHAACMILDAYAEQMAQRLINVGDFPPPDNNPPYLVIEKAFWKCPVSVFTGFTFLVVGICLGLLI